jgi:hypothetical protein
MYQLFIGLALITAVLLGAAGFVLIVVDAVTVVRDLIEG